MSTPLDTIPEPARSAWTRLRDELVALLDDDLIAMWAYGGTTSAPPNAPIGDLDTFVVVRAPVDPNKARAIEEAQAAMAANAGIEWDTWYVDEMDARRSEMPRHAWRDRLNESWAIDRAHWLAGRYVLLYGAEPAEIVLPPTDEDLSEALTAEVEHLERHVAAGDTDPYEATYAFLNGSRILHALETGDVAMSKREAGVWALKHLPERWHPALRAAARAYDSSGTTEDAELLAAEMARFVAMVRAASRARD